MPAITVAGKATATFTGARAQTHQRGAEGTPGEDNSLTALFLRYGTAPVISLPATNGVPQGDSVQIL
jgi:hypothetical protein